MSALSEILQRLGGSSELIAVLQKENAALKRRDEERQKMCDQLVEERDNAKEDCYDWQKKCRELERRCDDLQAVVVARREEYNALAEKYAVLEQAVCSGQGKAENAPDEGVRDEQASEANGDEGLLDLGLDAIGLSVKTYNCLVRYRNCQTVGDVCKYSALHLLKEVRNFGQGCLNELNHRLGQLGLKLADEEDEELQRRANKILAPSRAKMTPIEALGLSVETETMLRNCGMLTVNDLLSSRDKKSVDVRHIRFVFGNGILADELVDELLTKLRKHGFPLKK